MALSLQDKIGQLLIVGIQGHSLTSEEKKFLTDYRIGGVILFSRNFANIEQLHALTSEIHSLRKKIPEEIPFFISVDMEGGRVARFKDPFTVWPAMSKVGFFDSTSVGFKFAETMAQELSSVGVNLNFAPSLDILTNPKNSAIGDRAFGSDAEVVSKVGSSVVRGFIKGGVLPCAKHFPGHGNTLLDSHFDLPVEDATLDELRAREFAPFKKAFRARLDLVMTTHILYKQIDPEWPATLSSIFLTDILRGELGYRHLIITDDLDMKALRKLYSVEQIAVRALKAGAQILLYCNEPESPVLAIEGIRKAVQDGALSRTTIDQNFDAIIKLKAQRIADKAPLSLEEVKKILARQESKDLAMAIREGRLPVFPEGPKIE